MVEKKIYESELVIDEIVSSPYKYGFTTDIETEAFPKGIDLGIVQLISKKKDEPDFLLNFRTSSFLNWQKMMSPKWAYLKLPDINYQDIQYYSVPKTKTKLGSLEEVDPEILETFNKLGISLNEQKLLANVAVDLVSIVLLSKVDGFAGLRTFEMLYNPGISKLVPP